MDQSPLQRALAALSNVYQTGKEKVMDTMQAAENRGAVGNITDALKGFATNYTSGIAGLPVDARNMVSSMLSPEGGGNPYAESIRNLIGKPNPAYGSEDIANHLGIGGEGLAYNLGEVAGPGMVKHLMNPAMLGVVRHGLPEIEMPFLAKDVIPSPQRWLDPTHKEFKPTFGESGYEQGGKYLSPGKELTDVTGQKPSAASISVSPEGKASFKVADLQTEEQLVHEGKKKADGSKIMTNLFKQEAGWKWVKAPEGFSADVNKKFPLVSVEHGKDHYYTLQADYPRGVELSRYAESKSEPRLRPTIKGDLYLGKEVGRIRTNSGKEHPVYDRVILK